ncbi:hypothetical protein PaecuDRAFT_1885 [Paenibacillus curdlanolyticus YK9]|uniref:Uncharacterized protein n=1 Tax=Paenibacillus curdlanolyticus YK9 TaxID=717606 RepID=E0I8D4_9BACL|nr:hypothetical protein PaecuDRAFT_1885 [Paenibacillus curdlanolyticus YK9]
MIGIMILELKARVGVFIKQHKRQSLRHGKRCNKPFPSEGRAAVQADEVEAFEFFGGDLPVHIHTVSRYVKRRGRPVGQSCGGVDSKTCTNRRSSVSTDDGASSKTGTGSVCLILAIQNIKQP